MITLIDSSDSTKYKLTDNEFRAIYVLVSDCLNNMGGDRPSDIYDDPLTWTDHEVLFDTGNWSREEAKGTYGALDKKGLIFIDRDSTEVRYEDMVNEFVFDMFEEIWDTTSDNQLLKGLID
ncbi:MAG: hypothetical protein KZQ70_11310 [gamma proteobacterium symbiont of Lucinoma myriamae]|nr:hypothetical protein [gamma proteobacterium symbiont of Lucinoma myriamae]MCU7820083.1 hypothetical protein [gamma proteobacterium symbiont of Lucinoma myriamae]